MQTLLGIVIAILGLMVIVVIHEAGHYSMGRLFGFQINEFSIGMGPAVLKKKMKNGILFSIRCLPLGGYCAFEGEDEGSDNPRAFVNKKPWQRLIVLFAGAFFNLLSAIVIISLTFTFYGDRLLVVNQESMTEGASYYGFELGDVVYEVDGVRLSFYQPAPSRTEGQTTRTYLVERNGEKITIEADVDELGTHNLVLYYTPVRISFFESFPRGFRATFEIVDLVLDSLAGLFTGGTKVDDMGGPVSVITTMGEAASSGLGIFLYVMCLISANLAVFNLLPIPALDGMRMVFVAIEWIIGHPVNRKVEAVIHGVGLIALFVFAIGIDFIKLL